MFVCSIKDAATDLFGTPMFLLSIGHAKRVFSDEVNRAAEENQLYKHPADFSLYHLGFFETENAVFDMNERPMLVDRAVDVVTKTPVGEVPQLRSVN